MWLDLDGIAEEWGFSPTFAPHHPLHRNVYVIALSQSTRVLLGNDFCMECYIPRSNRSSFSAQCRHSSPLDVEEGAASLLCIVFQGSSPPNTRTCTPSIQSASNSIPRPLARRWGNATV